MFEVMRSCDVSFLASLQGQSLYRRTDFNFVPRPMSELVPPERLASQSKSTDTLLYGQRVLANQSVKLEQTEDLDAMRKELEESNTKRCKVVIVFFC